MLGISMSNFITICSQMASQQSGINMRLGAAISDCCDADLGDKELKLEQKYGFKFD